MELVAVVSTVVSVSVSVIVVVLILCYKYRRYKNEKKRRDKLYGELYVKLYKEEDKKQRKKPCTQAPSLLCQGIVQTYDHHTQVGVINEGMLPGESISDGFDPTPRVSKPPIVRLHSEISERTGSTTNLTPTRSLECLNSGLKSRKNTWMSMSNLLTPKSKPYQRKRSSHSMTSPLSYNSIDEALTSPQGFYKDLRPKFTIGSSIEEADPEIIVSMLHRNDLQTLTVTIHKINYLYKLVEYDSVYIQGHIRPRNCQKQSTSTIEGDELEFFENFLYDDMTADDVIASHLMLTVHKGSNNNKVIAELFINLALLDLTSKETETSHFKFPLILKKRSRRKSTLDKLLKSDLGELLLLLYYQPLANRLKVVVNKARSLPKTETSPFKADYQIIIDFYDRVCDQILQTKTTLAQSSENPTWNEGFHFDLESSQLNDYYLEFTVLEKRRYKPSDAVIGHVVLGPDKTTSHAIKQWNDCLTPSTLELARWHAILPVIRYNTDY